MRAPWCPIAAALLLLVAWQSMPGGLDQGAYALLTDGEQTAATVTAAASFSGTTYYLHNAPTPPVGSTAAQADLGMTATAPSAVRLYDYDSNLDTSPGRLIQRGGSGASETTLARYQNWLGPSAGLLGQNVKGTVLVEFWSGVPGFAQGVAGEVRIFLRDVDPLTGTRSDIANTTVSSADWQGGSGGWVKRSGSMAVNRTLLVGHRLELKLVLGSGAASDLWLAYDTTLYRSRLRIL